ncbi:MAG: beta-ketoacyl-[Prevotella sp.]|nr:beta-ketoacyl-[acyl-carrier-protein] synthase family protein [Prevotella sp.]
MNQDIVITGSGIVSAIGLDCPSVLTSLQQGTSGIAAMRHLKSVHTELPVGEVPLSDSDMKVRLGIDLSEEVSRTALLGMMAVEQALADGKVTADEGKRRIVLVSGTTVGGMDLTEEHFPTFEQPDGEIGCLLQHDAGSCTRLIASHFGLFADFTTISTACSSAANALLVGAEMLRSGQADIVVAGGTEALTRFHLNGFNALMILDREQCRPFDDTRAGLNLGEGAAYVVLEREDSAQSRGADVKAWLTGWGNACDAFHQTASSPSGEGAYRAMMQALAKAGLMPSDIDYVNAHGTGTPNNDLAESTALKRVFGSGMPPVSSTKQLTGHTCSSSGSIETVICLLAMSHSFIPANVGWKHAMSDGIVPTMGAEGCRLRHVMCNSFGFGGNDTSLVLSAMPVNGREERLEGKRTVIEAARVEFYDDCDLTALRQYVKPLESRRMGRIMKSAILASMKALEEAGIDTPDAIVTATPLGCLENSEMLLRQLRDEGESMFSPTHFMQSTHNTIGSAIAIRTGCHGYNITYTQGSDSLRWAMEDARRMIENGECSNVLVGLYEETTPLYRTLMQRLGVETGGPLHALAVVMKSDKL